MEPTFRSGDVVVVLRAAYGVPRPFREGYLMRTGEPRVDHIVTARFQSDTAISLKRVVGVAGEDIVQSAGSMSVGGRSYSTPGDTALFAASRVVPEDRVVLLGDNRSVSTDSRSLGFVPLPNIYGRVLVRIGARNVGHSR